MTDSIKRALAMLEDKPDTSGTVVKLGDLRALSARVEELNKEVTTLSDELDMREQEGCDFDTELIHAEQQAFRNGRLQGLEDAAAKVRSCTAFGVIGEEIAQRIEALKGEQK